MTQTQLPHTRMARLALPLALLGLGAALPALAAPRQTLTLGQRTYTYTCTGKQTVQVTYVTTGPEHSASPVFLVLKYGGRSYGLAEAVSGSGARYVGHAGLSTASGLEWWEHQGEGTLSTFRGEDAGHTKTWQICTLKG